MNQSKATRTVTVTNRAGLHARAALAVVNLVRRYHAKVELIKDRRRVDSVDMLQMLSLGAAQGEELTVEATGEEAEAAVQALAQLFADKFNEEDQQPVGK